MSMEVHDMDPHSTALGTVVGLPFLILLCLGVPAPPSRACYIKHYVP